MKNFSIESRQIHSIDVWRFIAMFFVVAIHIPFKGFVGQIIITFGKTAVPFFIITSGFFCYKDDDKEFCSRLIKQAIRLFIIFIAANIFYCLFNYLVFAKVPFKQYIKYCLTKETIKKLILVNQSPFADHLWFLGSIVYAMIFILIFVKFKIFKFIVFLSPLFLAVYICMTYFSKIDFIYCRNSLFCTMPYFMFGCLIKKFIKKIQLISTKLLICLTVLFSAVALVELNIYRTTAVVFLGSEFLVLTLFLLLIKFPNFGKNSIFEYLGRRDTLFVYIFHFVACYYFWHNWNNLNSLVTSISPIIVFCFTYIIAEFFTIMKKLFQKRKGNL